MSSTSGCWYLCHHLSFRFAVSWYSEVLSKCLWRDFLHASHLSAKISSQTTNPKNMDDKIVFDTSV
ncbi:unnamed protein product [Tenebrio molitor]|nr:unnamed protein product [Tenebrio molitor]